MPRDLKRISRHFHIFITRTRINLDLYIQQIYVSLADIIQRRRIAPFNDLAHGYDRTHDEKIDWREDCRHDPVGKSAPRDYSRRKTPISKI